MATGKAKPSVIDPTGPGKASAGSAVRGSDERSLDIDPAQLGRFSSDQPWRLRHMMYFVAVAAVIAWMTVLVARSFVMVAILVLGFLLLVFLAAMGAGVLMAWRATTRQETLLQILAIAAEGGMPLAPAVAAFADQYRGLSHRRMMNLAARLNAGTPAAEALEISRGLVSRDAVLLAWVGEAAGLLPKALRIAATSRSSQLPIWTAIAARIAYILIVMLGLQGIGGYVLYFIVPRFEAISRDFNLALPQVTIMVIRASNFLMYYGAPGLLLPIIEIVLLFLLPFSFLGWGS